MRVLGLIASLILASATLVHAQAYDRQKRTVGDTWSYTSGLVITVVKVSDDTEVHTRSSPQLPCPTCLYVLDKDGNLLEVQTADGKPADVSSFGFLPIGMKLTQYPLEVKKTWRVDAYGLFRGNHTPYVIDCSVSALQDVKTKAGTFKAYRIDRSWTIKVAGGQPPSWNDSVWISPDVKGIAVKFETGARAPSFELQSYKIAP
jgi:hypothetical protein